MRRLPLILLVLGLVVVACNGSGEDNTTTSTNGVTTVPAAETTTTESGGTTTGALTATTTAGGTAGARDECLVGSWVLDTEAFVGNFASIFAAAGMPDAEVTALDGTFVVEIGVDGSLVGSRDGWGFRIMTGEGTVILEINGTETGTWSADGSTLIVNTDESDLTVNSSIELDGQIIEMPADQMPVDTPPGIASDSDYVCSGDTLTLTNGGVESVLNRG